MSTQTLEHVDGTDDCPACQAELEKSFEDQIVFGRGGVIQRLDGHLEHVPGGKPPKGFKE